MSLNNKVVLITGATSGIGKATAQLFFDAGAKVAITDLPGKSHYAEEIVQGFNRIRPTSSVALTLDVRDTYTIPFAIDQVIRQLGDLNILINNAGTQLLKSAFELEDDEFDEVLNVNLKGAFFCAQAAALHMRDNNGGVIINIASQHGVVGNSNRAPYCSSKAGLINLTRALAIEWAEYGIRVNAVSPTFVETETNGSLLQQPEIAEEINSGVLLGRAATAREIAAGVKFLSSQDAAMITGHNLLIDGGWTAK